MLRTPLDEANSTALLNTLCLPGSEFQLGTKQQPKHIKRAQLKSLTRMWQALLQYNILPTTHSSDITLPRAKLVYCIIQQRNVDLASLISKEIHAIVLSQPSKSGMARPLAFPGLITGLCKACGVVIPKPFTFINRPINQAYYQNRINNAKEFDPIPTQPHIPPQQETQAPQPIPEAPFDMSALRALILEQDRKAEERHQAQLEQSQLHLAHLRHLHLQQAANHRAQLAHHSYCYNYTLHQTETGGSLYPWPTLETFVDQILWPGDSPISLGGVECSSQESIVHSLLMSMRRKRKLREKKKQRKKSKEGKRNTSQRISETDCGEEFILIFCHFKF
uniref:Putative plant transposon protein domain-containing protein n=1 Tax=Cajanus cajan TaxID=3821 RepID=A0A151UD34_CAJCA